MNASIISVVILFGSRSTVCRGPDLQPRGNAVFPILADVLLRNGKFLVNADLVTCEYTRERGSFIGYINGNTESAPYSGEKERSPIKFRGNTVQCSFELLKSLDAYRPSRRTSHMTAAMAKALRAMAAKFNPNSWVSLRYYEGTKSFSVAVEDFQREAVVTFRRSGTIRSISWFPSR